MADVDVDRAADRIEYAHDAAARAITRRMWQWNGVGWGLDAEAMVVARSVARLELEYFDGAEEPPAGPADMRRAAITVAGSRVAARDVERYAVVSEARTRKLP